MACDNVYPSVLLPSFPAIGQSLYPPLAPSLILKLLQVWVCRHLLLDPQKVLAELGAHTGDLSLVLDFLGIPAAAAQSSFAASGRKAALFHGHPEQPEGRAGQGMGWPLLALISPCSGREVRLAARISGRLRWRSLLQGGEAAACAWGNAGTWVLPFTGGSICQQSSKMG